MSEEEAYEKAEAEANAEANQDSDQNSEPEQSDDDSLAPVVYSKRKHPHPFFINE